MDYSAEIKEIVNKCGYTKIIKTDEAFRHICENIKITIRNKPALHPEIKDKPFNIVHLLKVRKNEVGLKSLNLFIDDIKKPYAEYSVLPEWLLANDDIANIFEEYDTYSPFYDHPLTSCFTALCAWGAKAEKPYDSLRVLRSEHHVFEKVFSIPQAVLNKSIHIVLTKDAAYVQLLIEQPDNLPKSFKFNNDEAGLSSLLNLLKVLIPGLPEYNVLSDELIDYTKVSTGVCLLSGVELEFFGVSVFDDNFINVVYEQKGHKLGEVSDYKFCLDDVEVEHGRIKSITALFSYLSALIQEVIIPKAAVLRVKIDEDIIESLCRQICLGYMDIVKDIKRDEEGVVIQFLPKIKSNFVSNCPGLGSGIKLWSNGMDLIVNKLNGNTDPSHHRTHTLKQLRKYILQLLPAMLDCVRHIPDSYRFIFKDGVNGTGSLEANYSIRQLDNDDLVVRPYIEKRWRETRSQYDSKNLPTREYFMYYRDFVHFDSIEELNDAFEEMKKTCSSKEGDLKQDKTMFNGCELVEKTDEE